MLFFDRLILIFGHLNLILIIVITIKVTNYIDWNLKCSWGWLPMDGAERFWMV